MTWENQSTKLNRSLIHKFFIPNVRRRNPTCTKKYYYIQKRARFEFDFFFFLKVRNRSRCANQSQALHSRGFAHIPNSSTQVVTATQWSKSKYLKGGLTHNMWEIQPSFKVHIIQLDHIRFVKSPFYFWPIVHFSVFPA